MNVRYITTFAATEAATEHVTGETAHSETEAHTTAESGAHGAESEGIGALGLSLPSIGASAITFLVLFFVIKKFALEGIVGNLQKREKDINRGLHLSGEMDKMKAELDDKVDSVLRGARKDADGIIAEAHSESGGIIKAAEESAITKAADIMRSAEDKIEREIVKARNDLKGEMASLITEATEAVLDQKLDAKEDSKLVTNYLSKAMK